MIAHTPEPWAHNAKAPRCILGGKSPRRKTICLMQNTQDADWTANRDLILAAPALLASIEALFPSDQWPLQLAVLDGPAGSAVELTLTCTRAEVEALHRAIARAKGAAPPA